MGNENLEADRVYEFWRWEYLRRNEEYKKHYNQLASYFNQLGIVGFKYIDINEYENPEELSVFDCLETEGNSFIENKLDIFYWLFETLDTFKIFPPMSPVYGISSKELLGKVAEEEITLRCHDVCKDIETIDYKHLPKTNYMPFPVSSVIKKKDVGPPSLPDPIFEANSRFLSQNPQFKAQSDNLEEAISNSQQENIKSKGKYEVLSKAPSEKIVTRDRKIIVAMDKYFKSFSSKDYRTLNNELRNKIRESLKHKGTRVKSKNKFKRAIGLYLWDKKNEDQGQLTKKITDLETFLKELSAGYEEKYKIDTEFLMLPAEEDLRKIVKQTEHCINQIDMLPIS